MRLARWVHAGAQAEGFVIDGRVVAFPEGATVTQVLEAGLEAAHELHRRVRDCAGPSVDQVRWLAPLVPSSIRDFVAFEEHVEGVSASVDGKSEVVPEWYQAPTFYFTQPHGVLATGDVLIPPETQRLDVELEVAAVIGGVPGEVAKNLTPEAAQAHIFGYTIMNDWSARDLQSREMKVKLGPAKGKDFGTTLGPWIVSADEVEGRRDAEGFLQLRAELFINDKLIGHDLLSNMGWPFEELVAYAARNALVVPGDVLGSGTVGNGGCLGELWGRRGELTPRPLQEGDVVRMVVEGLGEISNRVGAAVALPPVLPARRRPRARCVDQGTSQPV